MITPNLSVTKLWENEASGWVKKYSVLKKLMAINEIKRQPFFGDGGATSQKCRDTIKIRRPVKYSKVTEKP